MAAMATPSSGLRRIQFLRVQDRRKPLKRLASAALKDGSAASSEAEEDKSVSVELRPAPRFPQLEISSSQPNLAPRIPRIEASSNGSNLRFDRLQPSDEEFSCEHRRAFGRFVAREALLDEELWTAAWLRAESHWEDRSDVRYVETYKRQFADQEFNALKKRCSRQHAEKCVCIVAIRKDEKNVKRTVLKSIVGTLDLSIRHLLCGETFPGLPPISTEQINQDMPMSQTYVLPHARRQGIATNMLLLAIDAAVSYGTNRVFVHVHKNNTGAQKLYDRIGFQMVKKAVPHLLAEDKHLLCLKIKSDSSS
ncbi:FR47-like protein [Musa troglodytarum]|uniref:FR47-like protein n=1 Tax=Musa troglodytarum TaxID=320322 RepID=A0A9E7I718_9LILI|nr:FR47-like protein [Musa troglodytarum]URE46619.1 FR47-like protein [Musa troglodytarum]